MKPIPSHMLPNNTPQGLKQICENSKLVHYDFIEMGYGLAEKLNGNGCNIQILNSRSTLTLYITSIPFQKGNPYRRVIDHQYVLKRYLKCWLQKLAMNPLILMAYMLVFFTMIFISQTLNDGVLRKNSINALQLYVTLINAANIVFQYIFFS